MKPTIDTSTSRRFANFATCWVMVFAAGLSLCACSTIEDDSAHAWIATVEAHNPSTFARSAAPVYLPFYDLGLLSGKSEQPLVVVVAGNVVPSEQVDRDGDGEKDGLFTLLNLAAGQTQRLEVRYRTDRYRPVRSKKQVQAELAIKKGGDWVAAEADGDAVYRGGKYKSVETVTPPDEYSEASSWVRNAGPALEAPSVGYRFFLDEEGGYAVFDKLDPSLVLHRADPDGTERADGSGPVVRKLLELEAGLGAGGFGFWRAGELLGLTQLDSRSATVIDDGHLRASLRFDYFGWQVPGARLDAEALLSLDAGSGLLHNRLSLSTSLPNLAVSLGDREDATLIEGPQTTPADDYTYLATWGESQVPGQTLGLALFVRQRELATLESGTRGPVAVLKPTRGKVDYYLAAIGASADEDYSIATESDFRDYLQATAAQLSQNLYLGLDTVMSRDKTDEPMSAERALYWAKAMADSELTRDATQYRRGGWDPRERREPGFDYDTAGMLPQAMDALGEVTGEERFSALKTVVTASFIGTDGQIARYKMDNFNLANIPPGRVLLRLAQATDDERFQLAASRLRDQLARQPRVGDGGYAQRAELADEFWLAGLYMAMPFLAEDAARSGSTTPRDLQRPFALAREHLRDSHTGLYASVWRAHADQEPDDPDVPQGPFRGRDIGFLAMALVDVLAAMPQEPSAERAALGEMTVELARTLRDYRDPERGVWWHWLDRPGATGNFPESSATAMFTYFFAKAINLKLLSDADLGGDARGFANAALEALNRQFLLVHPDGKVSLILQARGFGPEVGTTPAARVADAASGTAAYILAAIEVHRMLQQTSAVNIEER